MCSFYSDVEMAAFDFYLWSLFIGISCWMFQYLNFVREMDVVVSAYGITLPISIAERSQLHPFMGCYALHSTFPIFLFN